MRASRYRLSFCKNFGETAVGLIVAWEPKLAFTGVRNG